MVDASGRRIGRKVDGSLVQGWIYAGGLAPVAETDGAGSVTTTYVYGTRVNVPEYFTRGGRTYRIVTDQLGSVRLVADASDGSIAQRIDYDAFGRVTLDTNSGFQPFGFAGGLYEPQTGLIRLGARDYDPESGRWTTKDPIGFAGGSAELYTYVENDPINFVDPSGLEVEEPGFWEGLIPIWGSGKQAVHEFQTGHWAWGTFDALVAVSDAVPLRAVVGAGWKFGVKGVVKFGGSHTWGATKKWLIKGGWREFKGQEFHHWLIPQGGWGKHVPEWIRNQPWNLMRMPDDLGKFHDSIHGTGEFAKGLIGRLWHGSPTWAKALLGSGAGRDIDALFNETDDE